MKRGKGLLYLVLVITVCALSACSQYEKLRKSSDYQRKYDTAFQYYNAGDYVRAGQLFDDIVNIYKGTAKADTVMYYQAMSYFMQRDYLMASHYFNTFYKEQRLSPFAEDAEYRTGYCYYLQAPRPALDQTNSMLAMEAFQMFLIRHPESEYNEQIKIFLRELEDRLVDKSYLTAKLYYNLGQYKASISALSNSLADYPQTTHREELMFLLLKSNFLLAENSIMAKRKERYQATLDEYYSFVGEFPQSKYSKEVKQIYEKTDKFLTQVGANNEEDE